MFFAEKICSFFKTQDANEYFQKLKYFLKTQGKYSIIRQVHYPALPKSGRKEKPGLEFIVNSFPFYFAAGLATTYW